jgi:hypothetical protein
MTENLHYFIRQVKGNVFYPGRCFRSEQTSHSAVAGIKIIVKLRKFQTIPEFSKDLFFTAKPPAPFPTE